VHNSFLPGTESTFSAISEACNVPEIHIRRLLRQAMVHRIFAEPKPGIVAHTAASAVLVRDPSVADYIGMETEDAWPAATKQVEAIEIYGLSEEPTETGFNVALQTTDSFYTFLGKNPSQARRFGNAMAAGADDLGRGIEGFSELSWEELGEGLVVDVGGNHGHTSMDLARAYPKLKFIVEDRPEVIANGRAALPEEFTERISFQEHDFFSPQPVFGADVYMLRWILHNWPDKYAIKILKALVPGMKKGAKVVLVEIVLQESGTLTLDEERYFRSMDLIMMTLFNSRLRGVADWKALFTAADSRFIFKGATRPEGSQLSAIEAVWEG